MRCCILAALLFAILAPFAAALPTDPPANDNLAAATGISGVQGISNAFTTFATKQGGEPNHANNAGGKSVWWTWTAPQGGSVTFKTEGSNFRTLIGAYTGTNVATLDKVTSNTTAGNGTSQITFNVNVFTTYKIAVDGFGGANGIAVLQWTMGTPPPPNDNFADADVLTSATGQITAVNLAATKQGGEPNHAGNAGGRSIWYAWDAPTTGTALVDTTGAAIDTLLAVYRGDTVTSLALLASNDDANGGQQSALSFAISGGKRYMIAVDGKNGAQGLVKLNFRIVGPPPANDAFAARIALAGFSGSTSGSNANATKQGGEPNHAGNAGGASVWWTWTAPATGTAVFDTLTSGYDTLLGIYTGTAVNALATTASNDNAPSSLQSSAQFQAVSGTTYAIAVDGKNAASGSIALHWTLTPNPPPNDAFASPTAFNGGEGTLFSYNINGSKQAGEPNHAGNAGGASVWFTWVAPLDGTVAIDTFTSTFDTVLGIYTGSAVNGLATVASNDDSGGSQSRASFAVTQGTVYRIAVDGKNGAMGSIALHWLLTATPENNDEFTDAPPLPGGGGTPGSPGAPGGTETGSNVGGGKDPGENNHAGNPGGSSVWWTWTAPFSGTVSVDTFGSDFDTLLAVYTGGAVNNTTLIDDNDDASASIVQSQVIFTVTAGQTYRIVVDGKNGAEGFITLNWNLTTAARGAGYQ